MKIIHTSDWHLGHRLYEQSQHEEQSKFLDWLHIYIKSNEIDILLISGDIFDTGVPSTQSQKLYYDFLINIKSTSCKHIIITGGNHDAPGTLNAPQALLDYLSIKVIGKATENIEDEIFNLKVNNEEIIICAVPYLRDQDIRRAVAGESFDDIGTRYKVALTNHYKEIGEICDKKFNPEIVKIAMGHLFAIGSSTSDSEHTIYVGNLGDISATDFPETFDYIALGHLHRAQIVGKKNNIRYSGSPNILSFSEINQTKKIVQIETNSNTISEIKNIEIPTFRNIVQVKGTVEESINKLTEIDKTNSDLKTWVEVILENEFDSTNGYKSINEASDKLNLEVLKVSLKNDRKITGLEQLVNEATDIKEFSPIEIFRMKCNEQNFELNENDDILDAFNEILQTVKESEL